MTERTDVRTHADVADHPRTGTAGADGAAPALGRPGPALLAPNRIERFYSGGARIDRLQGIVPAGDSGPEDWVGSTTTVFGESTLGLSRLADGRILRDAIDADPVGFLGAGHLERWGVTPALLVKLLDAGERLAVHFHPGREFARESLGLRFGKTEAWVIVEADPGAAVHLGLKRAVTPETVARWVADQDVPAMLEALHELPARAGDVFFVPAGTLHAIGAGILMVELQEPADLSIVLEWERFGVSGGEEHLRVGWERALSAVDLSAADPRVLRVTPADGAPPVTKLLPDVAAAYFGAERIAPGGERVQLEPTFAVLVVLDGWIAVWSTAADRLELRQGQTAVIPHGAGTVTVEGHGTMIRCIPPQVAA